MASTFKIEKQDRVRYEQSVFDPSPVLPADERAIRAEIAIWARKQKPGDEEWIYSWNAAP
jgi:hypothetical protein